MALTALDMDPLKKEAVTAFKAQLAVPSREPVTKANDPDTFMASWLKVPMLTRLSEKASMTGMPEMSLTENSDPESESVTENSCPWEPCTSSSVEPEPFTIRPFLTLNWFAMLFSRFHFPQGSVINID